MRASGAIASRGSVESFTLQGQGEAEVTGIAPVSWGVDAAGSSDALELKQLALSSSPYELALDGLIGWAGDTVADLRYRVSAAELQALSEALPPQLDASGVVSVNYRPEQVVVNAFSLVLEQSAMALQANGRVDLADSDDPSVALNLSWQSLGWPLATGADVVSPAGRITVAGRMQDWLANLSAEVTGGQVPAGAWSGEFRGGDSAARIVALTGNTLDGEISARGDVSLAPQPRWSIIATAATVSPKVPSAGTLMWPSRSKSNKSTATVTIDTICATHWILVYLSRK